MLWVSLGELQTHRMSIRFMSVMPLGVLLCHVSGSRVITVANSMSVQVSRSVVSVYVDMGCGMSAGKANLFCLLGLRGGLLPYVVVM